MFFLITFVAQWIKQTADEACSDNFDNVFSDPFLR